MDKEILQVKLFAISNMANNINQMLGKVNFDNLENKINMSNLDTSQKIHDIYDTLNSLQFNLSHILYK